MKRLCGETKGNTLFVTNVQDRIDYHTISSTSSSGGLGILTKEEAEGLNINHDINVVWKGTVCRLTK